MLQIRSALHAFCGVQDTGGSSIVHLGQQAVAKIYQSANAISADAGKELVYADIKKLITF